MRAYSSNTGVSYDSWDDLVAAEANGYLVIAVITQQKPGKKAKSWPYVVGPFATKAEAERVRTNTRNRWRREREWRYQHQTYRFYVRPAWKQDLLQS